MTDTHLTADVRARILERFEEWLDASLSAGREPDGIAAEILAQAGSEEAPPFDDFYSMWAAVTALTQEVRLQGRAFKQIGSSLEAAAGIPEAVSELGRVAGLARQERVLGGAGYQVLHGLLGNRERRPGRAENGGDELGAVQRPQGAGFIDLDEHVTGE